MICLLPSKIINLDKSDIELIIEALLLKYSSLLSGNKAALFRSELSLWQTRWKRTPNRPVDVLTSLNSTDPEIYPSIYFFLKVLAVMPVSVASAERSFSTLRRLKDYLRTTMTETSLRSLALMISHSDLAYSLDLDWVLDRFASKQRRRLKLIL